jgi:PUA domain protein
MPAKRYRLRKDELKELEAEVGGKFGGLGELFGKNVEVIELEDGDKIILKDGKEILAKIDGGLVPTLPAVDSAQLKRVVVDMGAVPHVANGANIMAPGVVSADDVRVGDTVVVVDERHGKAIAVGLVLMNGPQMKGARGPAVKNIHHVGDSVWRFIQESVK